MALPGRSKCEHTVEEFGEISGYTGHPGSQNPGGITSLGQEADGPRNAGPA